MKKFLKVINVLGWVLGVTSTVIVLYGLHIVNVVMRDKHGPKWYEKVADGLEMTYEKGEKKGKGPIGFKA